VFEYCLVGDVLLFQDPSVRAPPDLQGLLGVFGICTRGSFRISSFARAKLA